MKRALLLLTLIVATCCENPNQASQTIPTHIAGDEIRIYDVEHNGHQYVVFHVKGGYGEALQVLHDPDCKCQKKNTK